MADEFGRVSLRKRSHGGKELSPVLHNAQRLTGLQCEVAWPALTVSWTSHVLRITRTPSNLHAITVLRVSTWFYQCLTLFGNGETPAFG